MEEKEQQAEVKEPKTYDEQIARLKEHGCIIGDEGYAKLVLQRINYYRFSAYFLSFQNNKGKYREDTTFNKVHRTYLFDSKLRGILFPVIEEIEIYLRVQLSYYHAQKYGALGYMDEANYSKRHNHTKFLEKRNKMIEKNKNLLFVSHHLEKYNGNFPIWVIIELFTPNDLSIFYSDLKTSDQKGIALNSFNTISRNLSTWLHCFTILRNYCAHYSRLYYTLFSAQPLTPINFPYKLWKQVFDYILVLKFLYPSPEKWNSVLIIPLQTLLEEYNDCIKLQHIGFPNNWIEILQEQVPRRKT